MSGHTDHQAERQKLLNHLLDAVKQCQVRFGGKRELATEGDSRVTCLCSAWETAMSHGMRHTNKALSTLKQMTEMTGLSKMASNIGLLENIQNMETEPVFWQYVKEYLSKHEVQRYQLLRHVNTDAGRGRAWLRSTLNEHSLEKYMHMVLEDGPLMKTFYEDWAFVRDGERSSMMPMMAAGLGSILFAINIDNPDLNAIKPAAGLDIILSSTPPGKMYASRLEDEPRPVIPTDMSPKAERRKERKKKKKIAHIVSFDDDDGTSSYCSTSPGSSVTSPLVKTFGMDLGSVPTVVANNTPRAMHGFSGLATSHGSNRDMTYRNDQTGLDSSQSGFRDLKNISKADFESLETRYKADTTSLSGEGIAEGTQVKKPEADIQDPTGESCESNLVADSNEGSEKVDLSPEHSLRPKKEENSRVEDTLDNCEEKTDGSTRSLGKAVFNELRCPSVMTGNITVMNSQIEPLRDGLPKSGYDSNHENAAHLPPSISSAYKTSSFQDTESGESSLKSSQESDFNNESLTYTKEILLDWKPSERDGGPSNTASYDKLSEMRHETVNGDDSKEKRADSISIGYANMILDRSHKEEHAPDCVDDRNSFMSDSSKTKKEVLNQTIDSQGKTLEKDCVHGKPGASANDSPSRVETPSPARHPSRPESLKGMDILDRYKLPRSESPDSMPGSVSDSIKTTDSIKQRFGRWDSTDSADVRSITSNSSLGETVSPPGLAPNSDKFGLSQAAATSLTPVTPDGRPIEGEFMLPISRTTASSEDSRSYDSLEVPSYTEDTDNAAYALAITQQGLLASNCLQTLDATSPEAVANESLSPGELKQALVAMMLRKDEMENKCRALESAMDVERDVNTALRAEVENLTSLLAQQDEKNAERIRALSKENELLKHQLRKYVNAVQMLRTQGAKAEDIPGIHLEDPQPTIPPPVSKIDYSHEASEYEKKLIQVAEMHGELMEFNEVLHRQLNAKEANIFRLKKELTDLRGPLPEGFQASDDNVSVTSEIDTAALNRPLVNIWIPSAFLRGAGSDAFHVYQVYVRIRDEEWNIYRRYAEFHELHSKLKKKHPIVNTYEFPQKKTFGNRDPKFVEERRRKLQMYLRQVINLLLQTNPDFVSNVSRQRLLQVSSFFGDIPAHDKKSRSKKKASRSAPSGQSPAHGRGSAPQQHYMGL